MHTVDGKWSVLHVTNSVFIWSILGHPNDHVHLLQQTTRDGSQSPTIFDFSKSKSLVIEMLVNSGAYWVHDATRPPVVYTYATVQLNSTACPLNIQVLAKLGSHMVLKRNVHILIRRQHYRQSDPVHRYRDFALRCSKPSIKTVRKSAIVWMLSGQLVHAKQWGHTTITLSTMHSSIRTIMLSNSLTSHVCTCLNELLFIIAYFATLVI